MKSQEKPRSFARNLALAAGIAGVALGAAACAAKAVDKSPDEEAAASELRAEGHRHFGGPVRVVLEAARAHGNLSAEQATAFRAIEADLREDTASRKDMREKLKSSAVAIVRSGTARSGEFDRAVTQATVAIEQRIDQGVSALEEIHATLDPEQRKAVAAALRARIEDKLGSPSVEKRRAEGFDRFAAHLMLSTFQVDKLRAMKKELLGEQERVHPSREELLSLVDAFEGDDFSAALESFRAKKSVVMKKQLARAGERTDTFLSVLTPAQRELLADLIVEGPRKVLLGEEPQPEARR